ncbi:MAG: EAL domain-containing protein [Sporolactobacillus sp.]
MIASQQFAGKPFCHHFQPIVDLVTRQVIGYEALFRCNAFKSPEEAYRQAIADNRLYALDVCSIQAAATRFQQMNSRQGGNRLFINAYPSTVMNDDFSDVLLPLHDQFQASGLSIVLEIIESEIISNFAALSHVIKKFRQRGFCFAVDDFGKGMDNINRTIEMDADFIKLDRYFAAHLSKSEKKQAYVAFMADYCQRFSVCSLLEGVETAEDAAIAAQLGIQFGQGNLFGPPGECVAIARTGNKSSS